MLSTITNNSTNDTLAMLPDDQLLKQFADVRYAVTLLQVQAGHIEQEIYRRMEERGAKAIPDNTFICELEQKNEYSQELLAPLKEVLVETDLAAVLNPSHPETVQVPDKWATQKVLALSRRLPEVQAIVDRARILGSPKLRFGRKSNAENNTRTSKTNLEKSPSLFK